MSDFDSPDWSGTDLEQAYLKVLETLDAVDPPLPVAPPPTSDEGIPCAVVLDAEQPAPSQADTQAQSTSEPALDEALPVKPGQIIEAALFVGGGPLTAKRLCAVLRGSFDSEFVERTIDELNAEFVAEARPYEIRLGEGGYRLLLRPEYERLRSRVHGGGPREVRLSQDVLEILALVAYKQPISKLEIESFNKKNAGNLLRQLLQRELVALRRGDGGRDDVHYHTTGRFLSLFGLGSLDELPRADDVEVK